MKIFTYKGDGKLMASNMVVVAENIDEATKVIAETLESDGLEFNGITTEHPIKANEVIYFDNGDY